MLGEVRPLPTSRSALTGLTLTPRSGLEGRPDGPAHNQAEALRIRLENETKNLNATISESLKIRSEINAYRKERTLFDNVFKELEQQIHRREADLVKVLRKNEAIDAALVAAASKFAKMCDSLKAGADPGLQELLRESRNAYQSKLRGATEYSHKSILANLQNPNEVCEVEEDDQDPGISTAARAYQLWASRHKQSGSRSGQRLRFGGARSGDGSWDESKNHFQTRIEAIEELVNDFKLRTEENNITLAITEAPLVESRMADLKAEVGRLETEVD